jgi:hypothetical protein
MRHVRVRSVTRREALQGLGLTMAVALLSGKGRGMPAAHGGHGNNQRPAPPPSSGGTGAITHGDQLTINKVGPWTLQGVAKGSEALTSLSPGGERISTWPTDGRPSWIPGTDYVYNNSTSNHGGVVPAGGLTIDGYTVAAGTWVVQFRNIDISTPIIISGDNTGTSAAWPGVIFRGCRMRGNSSAPGFFNNNAQSTGGITWIMYCDAGGLDVMPTNICESIFESQAISMTRDHQYIIRTYLSIASTLAFGRNNGDAFIENYGEIVPRYFGDDTYHLNGLANSGGQTATMWLRNRLDFNPEPDSTNTTTAGLTANPYYKSQNDLIQMAADGGAYPGNGANQDGTSGYQIRDNYLAGGDHCLQLGVDKANTSADVSNVVVTGNKFSTVYFPAFGQTSISYKNPTWGAQGNVWSGNTYADDYGTGSWDYTTHNSARQYPAGNGPNAGTTISAPTNP